MAYGHVKPTEDRPIPVKADIGRIFKRSWGFEAVVPSEDPNLPPVYEKIEDANPSEVLFGFKDIVTAQPGWLPNIKAPVETTVGRLHLNCISICGPFGDRFPYVNSSPFNIEKIEHEIISKLNDTPAPGAPREPGKYYCDELIAFNNSIPFIEELSPLSLVSGTAKLLTPPPGINEYRDKLAKEYGEKLHDPVMFSEFEGKLKAYDREYLKDDPSLDKFGSGKVLNNARKKMFLTIGVEMGFSAGAKVNPILTSLHDEYPKDPEKLAMIFNGQRAGSYSRGAETVDGGVAEKTINRAMADYSIKDGDCGAKMGKENIFYSYDIRQLAGRYLVDKAGKSTLVENSEAAGNYLGKLVSVRSPQYCLTPGEQICEVCAGVKFAKFRFSLSIPVQEISATVLLSKLKKMHGTVLATADIEYHHFS